jgi:hypothetical protein
MPVFKPPFVWQVIKGPVTKYLPAECVRMGLSWSAEKSVSTGPTHTSAGVSLRQQRLGTAAQLSLSDWVPCKCLRLQ